MPDLLTVQCDYHIEVPSGQWYVFSRTRCRNKVRIHPEYRGVVLCHVHNYAGDRHLYPGGNAVIVRHPDV